MNETHRSPLNAKAIVGGVLIAIGILFTLDGFGLIDAGHLWEYWPLILILVGLKHVELRSEGKAYLKPQTLASLAASLDPREFVRVHRSHVVRIGALTRVESYAKGSYVAVLSDGSRVPVSREGHARSKVLLGK